MAVEYRGEFRDLAYNGSTQGLLWTIDIEPQVYGGATNTMKMAGQPLVINHMAASDDLYADPVKGSEATINIISETNFQYTGLYSTDDYYRSVKIYYGDTPTLYWRGFLASGYQEPYDLPPYVVSLTALDGLGLLKDNPFQFLGSDYTGRSYESAAILICLGKIGIDEFYEVVNVFEDNMSVGEEYSPMDQVLIDVLVFQGMNCYEVLEHILRKYNAVIRQSRGVYWIYRPKELNSNSITYRHFTAYDTKTDGSLDPTQLISRTAVTDLKSYNGGLLMIDPPISAFTAEQDYGYKESLLLNYKFDANTYRETPTVNMFDYWTDTYGVGKPVGTVGTSPGDNEGIFFEGLATITPNSTYYAYQEFGDNLKICQDIFTLEYDYKFINTTGSDATDRYVVVRLQAVDYGWYLDETAENTCAWTTLPTSVQLIVPSVLKGDNGWATAQWRFVGLPAVGPYRLTIFPSDGVGIGLAFRNIRLVCTSDQLVAVKIPYWTEGNDSITLGNRILDLEEVVTHTYIIDNSLTASEKSQAYILGDVADVNIINVVDQFKGSLAIYATEQLDVTADDFVGDHAAAYLTGGVVVSSVDNVIYFTGNSTTDFTGSTTITNTSGTLGGTVANVQAAVAGVNEQHTIELAGTNGTADIDVGGVNATATYASSLTQTATNFVTNNGAFYAAGDITVTSSGPVLTFEADNGSFGGDYVSSITTLTGDLTGDVDMTAQAYSAGLVRIDTVTLTGSSGAANILCDGVTRAADVTAGSTLQHTRKWSTFGNSEALPLIDLIAREMAAQYAREKHFIQFILRETDPTSPDFNVIYNLQDSLNTYGGNNRIFVVNRATLDAYRREWTVDAIEII